MQPFGSILSGLVCFIALVTTVSAVEFTDWPTDVHTGKPTTLKWLGDPNVPVTITLQKGPFDNLEDIKVLTSDAQGGSFTWVPDDALPESSDYAFKISQADHVNYSGQIQISGGLKQSQRIKEMLQLLASTSSDMSSSQNATQTTSMMTSTSTMSESQTDSTTTASDTQATGAMVVTTTAPAQTSSASLKTQAGFAATTGAGSNGVATGTQLGSSASSRESSLNWVLGVLGFVMCVM